MSSERPRRRSPQLGLGVALVTAMLVAAACGGSADEGTDPEGTTRDQAAAGVDLEAEFEYLGALATFETGPTTETFDDTAGSLELTDEATVNVPAGAFAEATEVTAAAIDLDVAGSVEGGPGARIYVVATAEDVELAEPLTLTLDVAPESVQVTQQIDGDWERIDLPAGPTTKVPIIGFSTVPTAVVDVVDDLPSPEAPDPRSEAAAEFLGTCLRTMASMIAEDSGDAQVGDYAVNMALKVCTDALVERVSPGTTVVSVDCVTDGIDQGRDFIEAVDDCAGVEGSDGPCGGAPATTFEGEVAGGGLIEGARLTVTTNTLELTLDPSTCAVAGSANVVRALTIGNPDNEECNGVPFQTPIDLELTGEVDETGAVEGGSLTWARDVAIAAGCADTFVDGSFGEWSGTWTATFFSDGSVEGTITLDGPRPPADSTFTATG